MHAQPGSPCFRHFRSVSQRHDELETMTELTAFLMALVLTVELGLAIAFGAAWLAVRLPGESDPPASSR
jgi:hypothetical protein